MSENNEDEINDIILLDLEIVGLNASGNNRSCCQHECCGNHVVKNDALRLVQTMVTISNKTEEAIKLVLIREAAMACTVAYVPRN